MKAQTVSRYSLVLFVSSTTTTTGADETALFVFPSLSLCLLFPFSFDLSYSFEPFHVRVDSDCRSSRTQTSSLLFSRLHPSLAMSSAPLSSRSSLFFQSPEQYFHWHRTSKPSTTSVARSTPSSSSIATRIIAPTPFYRSLRTPEPFEYSHATRRQSDSSQYSPHVSTRRYSMTQSNGKANGLKSTVDRHDERVLHLKIASCERPRRRRRASLS